MPKKTQDVQSESASTEAVMPTASSTKSSRKPRKTAARKKPAKKANPPRAKKTAGPTPAVPPPQTAAPTDEQIRMRAYFLGERRAQQGLPGDSDHDWLEARRQLFEEAGLSIE